MMFSPTRAVESSHRALSSLFFQPSSSHCDSHRELSRKLHYGYGVKEGPLYIFSQADGCLRIVGRLAHPIISGTLHLMDKFLDVNWV